MKSKRELAGTRPLSYVDVADVFESILQREVQAEKEEIRDWRLRSGDLSEYAFENLVRMFEYYDRWGLAGNPNVLRWLLQREPTSIETFVERTLRERDLLA